MIDNQYDQIIAALYDHQRKIKAMKEQFGGFGEFSKHLLDAELNILQAIKETRSEREKHDTKEGTSIVRRRG